MHARLDERPADIHDTFFSPTAVFWTPGHVKWVTSHIGVTSPVNMISLKRPATIVVGYRVPAGRMHVHAIFMTCCGQQVKTPARIFGISRQASGDTAHGGINFAVLVAERAPQVKRFRWHTEIGAIGHHIFKSGLKGAREGLPAKVAATGAS
ncbi:hypothetical protein D3C75_796810 [compost metagenome]